MVASGTMAVAFADKGVDETVTSDVECVYGEGNELGDAHRYGQEGNMEQKQVGEGLGQGNRFGGQDGLKAQDGRGAGNELGLNGLQQRLQDGSQSGVGNGERLMDTENCPNQ